MTEMLATPLLPPAPLAFGERAAPLLAPPAPMATPMVMPTPTGTPQGPISRLTSPRFTEREAAQRELLTWCQSTPAALEDLKNRIAALPPSLTLEQIERVSRVITECEGSDEAEIFFCRYRSEEGGLLVGSSAEGSCSRLRSTNTGEGIIEMDWQADFPFQCRRTWKYIGVTRSQFDTDLLTVGYERAKAPCEKELQKALAMRNGWGDFGTYSVPLGRRRLHEEGPPPACYYNESRELRIGLVAIPSDGAKTTAELYEDYAREFCAARSTELVTRVVIRGTGP